MEGTRNFSPLNRMDRGGLTSTYRGEVPGALTGEKAIPVAVRRGPWGYKDAFALDGWADKTARLQHPNILPLLGVAVSARQQHPYKTGRLFGDKRVDLVHPMMPVRIYLSAAWHLEKSHGKVTFEMPLPCCKGH